MHLKYQAVIDSRIKGMSYREIAHFIGVSKNSVSRWCKNLKIPLAAQKILEKKSNYPKELFIEYNRIKSEEAKLDSLKIEKEASREIKRISKRELKLIGSVLYWCEGQNRGTNNLVRFVNSDPEMIKLYLRFLREIIKISEDKFYISIRIHPNISSTKAINFWSHITNIPKEKFHISNQISRASQRKRPYNSLPYGTLSLQYCSRQKFSQIKGWISGIKNSSFLGK